MLPRETLLRVALAAAALSLACGVTDDQPRRVIGVIEGLAAVAPLELADTAHVGIAILGTVTTSGGGCLKADGATIRVMGSSADVTPFDLLAPAGTTCIAILTTFPRPISLTLTAAGVGTVRVHGRNAAGKTVTFEQAITVVP